MPAKIPHAPMVVIYPHFSKSAVRFQGLVPYPGIMAYVVRLSLKTQIVQFQSGGTPGSSCFEFPMSVPYFSQLYISAGPCHGSPCGIHFQIVGIYPLEEMCYGFLGM